jgi:hypothetical protein
MIFFTFVSGLEQAQQGHGYRVARFGPLQRALESLVVVCKHTLAIVFFWIKRSQPLYLRVLGTEGENKSYSGVCSGCYL